MAESQQPEEQRNGLRLAFGQTALQLGGQYLPIATLVILAILVPAAINIWLLARVADTLRDHRVNVAEFLSRDEGRREIVEHLSGLIEMH